MRSTPVSELKANLSRFLGRVKAGEDILITERGKPVAKMVPLSAAEDDEERLLRRMEAEGLVRLGSGRLPKGFWERPRPKDPTARVRRALLEERSERR
jgi:prevent-host-death family protein